MNKNGSSNDLKKLLRAMWKWSDADLANYYIDVCAYNDDDAIKIGKEIREIMVSRFVEKYADIRPEEENEEE